MTTLSKDQEKNLYAWCLHEGVNLEYGKLSLCDLRNFRHSHVRYDRRYQLHCEDPIYGCSMLYDDLGPAVNKFVELKSKVKRTR
jgi:hypothetical protein